MINGMCAVEIVSDPAELARAGVDKPFLRLVDVVARLPGGTEVPVTVELTINLAHMIGGTAAGAAERFGLPW
jgi:hypothetical protein